MLKKNAPGEIAGRELLVNERALPGLIDFLGLKHWFRLETKNLDYYSIQGQTLFPAYAADGGLAASMLFYLVVGLQTGAAQPRLNASLTNITIPHGYFGN
jgi:hypothetical protein